MEEQGDADVDVDGSDDDKFSTAAVTGGDVHSLPCKMGVRKSSSSTTVDSALNQINHIYAVLHEKQRAGKKVDSMYDEEQVAAAPDDEINNPLSNAKVGIVDLSYFLSSVGRSFVWYIYLIAIFSPLSIILINHSHLLL